MHKIGLRNARRFSCDGNFYDTDVCIMAIDEPDENLQVKMSELEARVLGYLYNLHPRLSKPITVNGVLWHGYIEDSDEGAACLLSSKFLKEVEEKLGDGYYIIPFSTQYIGFAKRENDLEIGVEDLAKVLYLTNRSAMRTWEERLSDSIWQYDGERETIKTVWFGGEVDRDYWGEENGNESSDGNSDEVTEEEIIKTVWFDKNYISKVEEEENTNEEN